MGLSWVEQAFWVLCVLAILGSYWWAKKTRDRDTRRARGNDRPH